MTRHLGDLVNEFALGALPAAEQAEAEAHVGACDECAAAVADATEALAALALTAPPVEPDPAARERLLAAATGARRFARFVDAVARFFDVAADRARALLDSVDEPSSWVKGPFEFIQLVHLEPGPACAGADAGFIRIRAGTPFPRHRHLGEERVLVLQGSVREHDGTILRPGDTRVMAGDTAHDFQVLDGPDFIYALVLYRGVEFDGAPGANFA